MKKFLIYSGFIVLYSFGVQAADIDLQQLDADMRSEQPASNSLMFRRNAEQYRQLSDDEKAEIARRREEAKRQMEEYERQRAAAEAQQRAMEEEARRRAEELKPITLNANKLSIYALVNGEVISSNDMQSRINAFILTTGIPYNEQTKNMIMQKVLQGAIDEKLKLLEAKKNNIRISKHELDNAVREFEKNNGMAAGDLRKILGEAKVSMNVWIKQIEADLAWKKLVAQKGYSRVRIGEGELNRAMEDVKKDMMTPKIMLLELVIAKKDAHDMRELTEVLRHDPRFELYAMQFSQSPSAANGGRLGWVSKGRLPKELEQKAFALKQGEVSEPILYGNDYYIYKLEGSFDPEVDKPTLPSRDEVRGYLENKKLEEFSAKYIKDLRSKALIEKKV